MSVVIVGYICLSIGAVLGYCLGGVLSNNKLADEQAEMQELERKLMAKDDINEK